MTETCRDMSPTRHRMSPFGQQNRHADIRHVELRIPEFRSLIAYTSVQHVIQDDYTNPDIKQQIDNFNANLTERIDDTNFTINNETTKHWTYMISTTPMISHGKRNNILA